jgi:hypothetical protein
MNVAATASIVHLEMALLAGFIVMTSLVEEEYVSRQALPPAQEATR